MDQLIVDVTKPESGQPEPQAEVGSRLEDFRYPFRIGCSSSRDAGRGVCHRL